MKKMLIGSLVFFTAVTAFAQRDTVTSSKAIGKELKKLQQSAEMVIHDNDTLQVECEFWHNNMPMADNAKICWHVRYDSQKKSYHYSVERIYFFGQKKVYIFPKKEIDAKPLEFYEVPVDVVMELFSPKLNQTIFVRKHGPFQVGEVE